jgi:hypothetical protein
MLSCILSTDMSKHFAMVNRLKTLSTKACGAPCQRARRAPSRATEMDIRTARRLRDCDQTVAACMHRSAAQEMLILRPALHLSTPRRLQVEEQTPEDQQLMMEAIVHAADLSNPLMEEKVSRKWSDACLVEFNTQAQQEQELGLPFDPKMLKNDIVSQANLNRGFIDYIVAPLWKTLATHFPPLEKPIEQMMANRAAWDQIITAGAEAEPKPSVRAVQ